MNLASTDLSRLLMILLISAAGFLLLALAYLGIQYLLRPAITYRYNINHTCTMPNIVLSLFGAKAKLDVSVELAIERRGQSTETCRRDFTRQLTKEEFQEYEGSKLEFVDRLARGFLAAEFGPESVGYFEAPEIGLLEQKSRDQADKSVPSPETRNGTQVESTVDAEVETGSA